MLLWQEGHVTHSPDQARKKSTEINLLRAMTVCWGGCVPCEGVVKPFFRLREAQGEQTFSPGYPARTARISQTHGMLKKFPGREQLVHFSALTDARTRIQPCRH